MSSQPKDIYFAYSDEDIESVRGLKAAFERRGLSTFFAEDEDYPDDHAGDVLYAIRRHCRCVVVVWTAHSVASDWCRGEASDALASGVLVQICLDETTLPREFLNVAAFDLIGWRGDPADARLGKISEGIGSVLAPERPENSETPASEAFETASASERGAAFAAPASTAGGLSEAAEVSSEPAVADDENAGRGETLKSRRWHKLKRVFRWAVGSALLIGAMTLVLAAYRDIQLWLNAPEADHFNLDPQALGPEMVVIPGGEFTVGSPAGESGASLNISLD